MTISEKALARRERLGRFSTSVNMRSDNPKVAGLYAKIAKVSAADEYKAVKAATKLASAIADAYRVNGPGLYVDRYLRDFLAEYNSRVLRGEGANMPTSFNVGGAFVEPDEEVLILKLLPEKYYNFSFAKMLDHITDPAVTTSLRATAANMSELTIYQINALGGYAKFNIPGNEEYVFCGVGFVREGDEMAIITVLGKTNRNPSEISIPADPTFLAPGKEFILDGVDTIDLTEQPLFDDEGFSPVILFTRVDTNNETVQVRYALEETRDTFNIVTDDPQTIAMAKNMSGWTEDSRQRNLNKFRKFEALFDISTSLISCLDLCDSDELVVQRHPTELRITPNSSAARHARSRLSGSNIPNYVNVATLFEADLGTAIFDLPASSIKMESTGYWKTLSLGSSGRDKNGQMVQGKTWVTTKESWFEEHLDDYRVDTSPVRVNVVGDDSVGEVYVLRSALHKKNVYKIGFTTKDAHERARQLGATSGQPDTFNVVQSWKVKMPRQIEQQVHHILAEYRINQNREFFEVKYEKIRATIDSVISESGLGII